MIYDCGVMEEAKKMYIIWGFIEECQKSIIISLLHSSHELAYTVLDLEELQSPEDCKTTV